MPENLCFRHDHLMKKYAAAAKSFQSCPTLCDPIDSSKNTGVGFHFSNAWKWKVILKSLNRVRPLVTPWTAAHQAPPSMGFSRQEHWSGLPLPSPMHESEKWKWSCSVVSDPQQPHGLQPTRLLRPWDFPGKSTGVGCHCLLQEETWCLIKGCFGQKLTS